MAVITASNFGTPISNADKGSNHQVIKTPASNTFTPGSFDIIPISSTIANATISSPYSGSITAHDGTAPFVFTITAGALPSGISMSSSGLLSGTPTVSGTFTFTVLVTDSLGFTGSQAFTLIVSPLSGGGTRASIFVS